MKSRHSGGSSTESTKSSVVACHGGFRACRRQDGPDGTARCRVSRQLAKRGGLSARLCKFLLRCCARQSEQAAKTSCHSQQSDSQQSDSRGLGNGSLWNGHIQPDL